MENEPTDILENFRQKARPKIVASHDEDDTASYVAFKTQDKLLRVEIFCKDGMAYAIPYSYLATVVYDYHKGARLYLNDGNGISLRIHGQRLRPISQALNLHTCSAIREFDPERFEKPRDPSAPFIESIKVSIRSGPETLLE